VKTTGFVGIHCAGKMRAHDLGPAVSAKDLYGAGFESCGVGRKCARCGIWFFDGKREAESCSG
jgi:hypothetical protein